MNQQFKEISLQIDKVIKSKSQYILGSHAFGTADQLSDIDLVIEPENPMSAPDVEKLQSLLKEFSPQAELRVIQVHPNGEIVDLIPTKFSSKRFHFHPAIILKGSPTHICQPTPEDLHSLYLRSLKRAFIGLRFLQETNQSKPFLHGIYDGLIKIEVTFFNLRTFFKVVQYLNLLLKPEQKISYPIEELDLYRKMNGRLVAISNLAIQSKISDLVQNLPSLLASVQLDQIV
jgi:predicted nucleotidyltransferase